MSGQIVRARSSRHMKLITMLTEGTLQIHGQSEEDMKRVIKHHGISDSQLSLGGSSDQNLDPGSITQEKLEYGLLESKAAYPQPSNEEAGEMYALNILPFQAFLNLHFCQTRRDKISSRVCYPFTVVYCGVGLPCPPNAKC